MAFIETSHLRTWADSRVSEGKLPHLLKQLIAATISPDQLKFPSRDAVWIPGFDGVLIASANESRWIPQGVSVWELGTDANVASKAADDYEKRTKQAENETPKLGNFPPIVRGETTFVFATPRVWRDKEVWAAKRRNENAWGDVRVVDGTDLQDWIEQTPPVKLQFASDLGLFSDSGLQFLNQAWLQWAHLTNPPTSEALATIERAEQERAILKRLNEPPSTFSVRGDSPREALGFILATLRRVEGDADRVRVNGRTVVADDENVASRLNRHDGMFIVLRRAVGQVGGHMSGEGAHVVFPEGNNALGDRNVIVLPRPSSNGFAHALEDMRLSPEEASRVARACGRSVTVLQRRLYSGNLEEPSWAKAEHFEGLVPAVLAGSWDSNRAADREILAQLSGVQAEDYENGYERVQSRLQVLSRLDDPPVRRIGSVWHLVAPVDAFELTARWWTGGHLECFKKAFVKVFSRIDPKVDLPPEEMSFELASPDSHSRWLRSGMADIILMIEARGDAAGLHTGTTVREYIKSVMESLPNLNEDWHVLASIRDQLPTLMEAAPDPLLDSLEQLLKAKPDELKGIFKEFGFLGGDALHVGLLWGLGALAWSPERLSRVTLALAGLARIDPGGQLSNRPINSLREIFLWWNPSTSASVEMRFASLDLILTKYPEVGWNLLENLLPKGLSGTSHSNPRPKWDDSGRPEGAFPSAEDRVRAFRGIVDRTLKRVGKDPGRWRAVLGSMNQFHEGDRERTLQLLRQAADSALQDSEKRSLWDVVRRFVSRHKRFQDARWALSEQELDRLSDVVSRLEPFDSIENAKWLFDEHFPHLPRKRSESIQEDQVEVGGARQQAVADIVRTHGVNGVLRLGANVRFPGIVAAVAVDTLDRMEEVEELVARAVQSGDQSEGQLAAQASAVAFEKFGAKWKQLIFDGIKYKRWAPSIAADLMSIWPDSMNLWEEIESIDLEVFENFWKSKPAFVLRGSPLERTYQLERFLQAGRAVEVFSAAASQPDGISSPVLLCLIDELISALNRVSEDTLRRIIPQPYETAQLLAALKKRHDVSRNELAKREYALLPLLGHLVGDEADDLVLHEMMISDPEFFMNVICDMFFPANRGRTAEYEPTPNERARAMAGFQLLNSIRRLPGQDDNDAIDEDVLRAWIDRVREIAVAEDRVAITDEQIGRVLAHAPSDPTDGAWPHAAVRSQLERLVNADVENGLSVERFNMRGAVSRTLDEGGAQERDLAAQYREWANASDKKWPHTAQVLRSIAESWERDARDEDIRAEQRKLR